MKGLRKKLAKIMAVLLVLGTFTPFPAVKAIGGISALASDSDAESALSDGEISGEKLLSGEEPSGTENGPELTVYNAWAHTYTFKVSDYCPATWSNAEYNISDNAQVNSNYIATKGYSIDQNTGTLSVSVKQVNTSSIPENGIGKIIVVISNPSVKDASVGVAVNIKVTNPQIKLSVNNTYLDMGTHESVTVKKTPEGYDAEMVWSSGDTYVATVDSNGLVTAIDKGDTNITYAVKDCPDIKGTVSMSVSNKIKSETKSLAETGGATLTTLDHMADTTPPDILSNSGAVYTQTGNTGAVSNFNSGSAVATLYSGSISEFVNNNKTAGPRLKNNDRIDAPLASESDTKAIVDNGNTGNVVVNTNTGSSDTISTGSGGIAENVSKNTGSTTNTGDNNLTIHVDVPVKNLTAVTMTAEATAQQVKIEGQFEKLSGSTIINFHKDFLDTLQPGNYIVRLNYGDKYIDTEITINGAPLHFPDGSVNSSYRAEAMETGGHFTGSGDFWSFVKSDGAWTSNEWICYNGRPYYIGKGGLMSLSRRMRVSMRRMR